VDAAAVDGYRLPKQRRRPNTIHLDRAEVAVTASLVVRIGLIIWISRVARSCPIPITLSEQTHTKHKTPIKIILLVKSSRQSKFQIPCYGPLGKPCCEKLRDVTVADTQEVARTGDGRPNDLCIAHWCLLCFISTCFRTCCNSVVKLEKLLVFLQITIVNKWALLNRHGWVS
jgi:hypothetical protein